MFIPRTSKNVLTNSCQAKHTLFGGSSKHDRIKFKIGNDKLDTVGFIDGTEGECVWFGVGDTFGMDTFFHENFVRFIKICIIMNFTIETHNIFLLRKQ